MFNSDKFLNLCKILFVFLFYQIYSNPIYLKIVSHIAEKGGHIFYFRDCKGEGGRSPNVNMRGVGIKSNQNPVNVVYGCPYAVCYITF